MNCIEITEGQLWTFVHADGTASEYVVDRAEPAHEAQAIVWLRNVATGKMAMVTKKWLWEAPGKRGHWTYAEERQVAA